MRRGNKAAGVSRSKSEAAHLDNLLDEALRETFPASDPIAITIDRPWKGIASEQINSQLSLTTEAASHELMVGGAENEPPIVGLYDANLWGLRQISYVFNWWSLLLWGRAGQ